MVAGFQGSSFTGAFWAAPVESSKHSRPRPAWHVIPRIQGCLQLCDFRQCRSRTGTAELLIQHVPQEPRPHPVASKSQHHQLPPPPSTHFPQHDPGARQPHRPRSSSSATHADRAWPSPWRLTGGRYASSKPSRYVFALACPFAIANHHPTGQNHCSGRLPAPAPASRTSSDTSRAYRSSGSPASTAPSGASTARSTRGATAATPTSRSRRARPPPNPGRPAATRRFCGTFGKS